MSVNYITIEESEFDKLVSVNAKLYKQLEIIRVAGFEMMNTHVNACRIDDSNLSNILARRMFDIIYDAFAEIERIGKS